jgi:hypothetical protein
MSACHVLQHVHSDLAVTTALEFLPSEKDLTVRTFLAGGLASQLAFEAIEPIRQLVLAGDYDESCADLKRNVVEAATLMEVEFPEREQWKAEVEQERLERESKLREESLEDDNWENGDAELDAGLDLDYEDEMPPARQKVGRNDPCPCGSGRKFKKCCLNKQRSGDLLI